MNPRLLGEMTVSMLRGEEGFQRKEIDKLTGWLRTEPAPDIVTLPNSLLIGLARPIREAIGRPVCCTLQGEDLFLSQLQEPYRTQSLELIRANVEHVDGFVAVSEYYAGFMCRYLGIPEHKMHVVPLGINLKGYDPGAALARQLFHRRVLRARGAGEGTARAGRSLHQAAARDRIFGGATLEAAGYLAPEHRDYLHGIEQQMTGRGPRLTNSAIAACSTARTRSISCATSTCSRVPSTYDEPKGIFPAGGDGERRAGGAAAARRFHRDRAQDRRRHSGGPGRSGSAGRGHPLAVEGSRPLLEELGRRGAAGRARALQRRPHGARALEVYGTIAAARVHA